MNITLSLDEHTVSRARLAAKATGKSLNQLIREYLQELAGSSDVDATSEDLKRLWNSGMGNSGGRKITREDAYD